MPNYNNQEKPYKRIRPKPLHIISGEEFAGESDDCRYPEMTRYETERTVARSLGLPPPIPEDRSKRAVETGKKALENMLRLLDKV